MAQVTYEPPPVGIVTPSLNSAEFIAETVDSVLAQNYPRLDYLVMDGGSSDGTLDLLRGYGDRLRLVSEPDGGQAAAVNAGLGRVRGEVVSFLNADDTLRRGAVGAVAAAFRRHPGAATVYGDADYVDERGGRIEAYPVRDFDAELLARECFICQPATFVTRAAFERAGGLDERLQYALDYDLWLRLSRRERFVRVPEQLATFRMHRANKTMTGRGEHYREAVDAVRRHCGYVPPSWLDGYAMHLLDRRDQFFSRSRRTRRSQLLSLALGVRHNPGQLRRFWREWGILAGLRDDYTERWHDGWISRAWVTERTVPDDCERVRVVGRNEGYLDGPLTLELSLAGRTLARLTLTERSPRFELATACPPEARGRTCRVAIVADRTWVPREHGDYRRLSCVIEELELR